VSGGVIVAYTGLGGFVHPVGVDKDHPELGAITIRLANTTCQADFLESPNGGGVYKVWVTPVSDFVGDTTKVDNDCGSGCYHGFVPSKTKTDNFKVKSSALTFCLTIEKLFTTDGTNFVPRAGWQMSVTDPLSVVNIYLTDVNGLVKVCGLTPGTYTVAETIDFNFFSLVAVFVNGVSINPANPVPTYSFTWTPSPSSYSKTPTGLLRLLRSRPARNLLV